MREQVVVNVEELHNGQAKLNEISDYVKKALKIAGDGNEVILTGQGPIWLYLKIAHELHGKALKLIYRSPVTGDVLIFDHSPY